MLQLSATLLDQPVLSLRTGGQIAMAIQPIINPKNLKVEGFYCNDNFSKDTLILLYQDVRDFLPQGIAVNDHDVLVEPDELVRLKEVINSQFELLGKPVFTKSKHRLGKVSDFATETTTMYVQKLYVSQPLYKTLTGGQLTVERTQIIEITDKKIVVQDPLQPLKASPAQAAIPAN